MNEYASLAQTFPEQLTAWTVGGLTAFLGVMGLGALHLNEKEKPISQEEKHQIYETPRLRYHPPN